MSAAHVVIAGGGIGGLCAALCLAHEGMDVEVLEQAHDFGEVGAGIQLSPNCSRVLHHLGLAPALTEIGFLPEGVEMRNWRTGALITSNALGEAARQRYGAPYYHVHRADLMAALLAAARAQGRIELRTGVRVREFRQGPGGVDIDLDAEHVHADVLIGADGIHSDVRTALFGPESPRFTGNVAWRALVPAADLPAGQVRPMATAWWGPGKHFVHYYVRGGELVNCVCVVEKSGWEQESWTEQGDIAELKADFAGWHQDLQALIDHMNPVSCFKWALFDRPPMASWGDGRVRLLGDACHPTLPFMAQGAAMAIEDGAVLARALVAHDDVGEALDCYQRMRRERTASIQRGSRRNARVFHMSGVKAWARDIGARRMGSDVMHGIYSYDPLTVPLAD